MVINNYNSLASLYLSKSSATAKQTASRAAKTKSFKDEMTISSEAQSFNELLKKLKNETEIRQEKVDEYSKKIAEGTYNVESENIAASMLMSRF